MVHGSLACLQSSGKKGYSSNFGLVAGIYRALSELLITLSGKKEQNPYPYFKSKGEHPKFPVLSSSCEVELFSAASAFRV